MMACAPLTDSSLELRTAWKHRSPYAASKQSGFFLRVVTAF